MKLTDAAAKTIADIRQGTAAHMTDARTQTERAQLYTIAKLIQSALKTAESIIATTPTVKAQMSLL